jgi:hypothetical protein
MSSNRGGGGDDEATGRNHFDVASPHAGDYRPADRAHAGLSNLPAREASALCINGAAGEATTLSRKVILRQPRKYIGNKNVNRIERNRALSPCVT